jgi:hypothetical protein
MEFKHVESLRTRTRKQRPPAGQGAAKPAQAEYSLIQRIFWSAVELLRVRYLLVNAYPLVAVIVGVAFIVAVDQTREILSNLQHEMLFLGALAVWAASIWYCMRVLSGTDFPGEFDPHPSARGVSRWLTAEWPRVVPFAGLVLIACASSIFLTEGDPSPHWIAPLAAGVAPMTWAIARLADKIVGLGGAPSRGPVYRCSTLFVALLAAAIASYSWSTVPQPMREAPQAPHLEDWLLGLAVAFTLLPLLLRRRPALAHCAMAGALVVWLWAVYRTANSHPGGSTLPFLILLVAASGLWFTQRRRELFSIKEDAAVRHFEVGGVTFVTLGVALTLQGVLVVAFTRSPIGFGMQLGTLGILYLALALLAFFGIVWVFIPKYVTWPSLALVPVIWLLFLGNTPDHTLRGTSFAQTPPERPRLLDHFDRWRGELPKRDGNPIFFVAAAGGGLRAAYWTATTLAAADDETCGQFGRHVYAYSGVSGGSLGVAAYLAQRQLWEAKPEAARCLPGRRAEIVALLERDFLAPVAGSLLFAEMTQRFLPLNFLDEDRGSVLAKAWSRAWDEVFTGDKGRFDKPFLEVFAALAPQDEAMPVRPAVFLNATTVASGRRAIASNVQVRLPDGVDLFRPVRGVGALRTSGLTLREAVLNSARFTYVSPAGAVHACAEPKADGTCSVEMTLWDQVVDGGYFENSGVATLSDIIRMLAIAREKALAEGTAKDAGPRKDDVFFIVIDNSSESELACREPRKPAKPGVATPARAKTAAAAVIAEGDGNEDAPPGIPSHFGVTAPMGALLHVREARGRLEVRRLGMDFSCPQGRLIDWNLFGDREKRMQAQAVGQEPALGWLLSRRSAKWIGARATEVAGQFPFRPAPCRPGKLAAEYVEAGARERTPSNEVCLERLTALKP